METARRVAAQIVTKQTLNNLVAAAVLFWIPALILVRLVIEIGEPEPVVVDSNFLQWLHSFANPALDQAMSHITNLADYPAIVLALVIGSMALADNRRWSDLTVFVAGVGGSAAINLLLKGFFHRPRPALWDHIVVETGYSFPSAHAMMSGALAVTALVLLWNTKHRWPAAAIGALYVGVVGISRMYLGVHFPTDVLAGWCISLIWVVIVVSVVRTRKTNAAA